MPTQLFVDTPVQTTSVIRFDFSNVSMPVEANAPHRDFVQYRLVLGGESASETISCSIAPLRLFVASTIGRRCAGTSLQSGNSAPYVTKMTAAPCARNASISFTVFGSTKSRIRSKRYAAESKRPCFRNSAPRPWLGVAGRVLQVDHEQSRRTRIERDFTRELVDIAGRHGAPRAFYAMLSNVPIARSRGP